MPSSPPLPHPARAAKRPGGEPDPAPPPAATEVAAGQQASQALGADGGSVVLATRGQPLP